MAFLEKALKMIRNRENFAGISEIFNGEVLETSPEKCLKKGLYKPQTLNNSWWNKLKVLLKKPLQRIISERPAEKMSKYLIKKPQRSSFIHFLRNF